MDVRFNAQDRLGYPDADQHSEHVCNRNTEAARDRRPHCVAAPLASAARAVQLLDALNIVLVQADFELRLGPAKY
jgi:hypothetical protein